MSAVFPHDSNLTRYTRNDPQAARKDVDLQIITDWIPEKSKVLDLGCGRGLLLEHLQRQKQVYGVGVDLNPVKIRAAIGRGINVYQGEMMELMKEFPAHYFDQVVLSRTLEDLARPEHIIREALRVGRSLIVGFVNHGYWLNRLHFAWHGHRIRNTVYPEPWYRSDLVNPITLRAFEKFCAEAELRIDRKVALRGSWKDSINLCSNLLAGYGLYQISRP